MEYNMTIDEAIVHAKEVSKSDACYCAEEHLQLAAWLEELKELRIENKRLTDWVNDLQSGMYINCVYCGHQYGPSKEVPTIMADVLKEHISNCSEHPMSKLTALNRDLVSALEEVEKFLNNDEQYSGDCGAWREWFKGVSKVNLEKVRAVLG